MQVKKDKTYKKLIYSPRAMFLQEDPHRIGFMWLQVGKSLPQKGPSHFPMRQVRMRSGKEEFRKKSQN